MLDSVRRQLRVTNRSLIAELQQLTTQLGTVGLATFLHETGLELEDLYKDSVGGWTALQRRARIALPSAGAEESRIGTRIGRLTHLDDPERLSLLARLAGGELRADRLDQRQRRGLAMLLAALLGDVEVGRNLDAAVGRLVACPALCAELGELAALLEDRAPHLPVALSDLPEVPLQVHATYRRNEIAAAFGFDGSNWREGVRFDKPTNADLLLITLNKSEQHDTPSTRYRDFVVARDLVHWESQSTTSQRSTTGRRYLEGTSRPMLFLRVERSDPYLLIGPGELVSAKGNRPIAITWRLRNPLPEEVFQAARRVAG